jgi:hypothetical protein
MSKNKKIFIAETSNGEKWEINHGFHLAEAENQQDAINAVKIAVPGETLVSIQSVEDFLRSAKMIGNTRVKTLIGSSIM